MKKMIGLISSALVVSVIVFGCGKNENKAAKTAVEQPGVQPVAERQQRNYTKAPDFTLKDLNGKNVSLSDYAGKLVFVNFWATWCPPCRAEIPGFIRMYDKYKDQGLEIIGISTDRNGIDVVKRFVDANKVNYPIVMYNVEVIQKYGGITGIPTTFVVNRKGEVVNKFVGFPGEPAFENEIQKWLYKKAS